MWKLYFSLKSHCIIVSEIGVRDWCGRHDEAVCCTNGAHLVTDCSKHVLTNVTRHAHEHTKVHFGHFNRHLTHIKAASCCIGRCHFNQLHIILISTNVQKLIRNRWMDNILRNKNRRERKDEWMIKVNTTIDSNYRFTTHINHHLDFTCRLQA